VIKEAIEKILSLHAVQQFVINEREYTDRALVPVRIPEPVVLGLNTLSGIKDYLTENPDGIELDTVLVHVVSPVDVRVLSRLSGSFLQRLPFVKASHEHPMFKFGGYMDIETFIIEMQAKFVQDEMTAKILQLIGTITDDQVQIYADDGITQSVVAKTSVGMQAQREVPNPVTLSPYRTFNEICQPEGKFILRMKSGTGTSNGRPAVMLVEADGGAWENEAIIRIRDWMRTHVPEEVTILV